MSSKKFLSGIISLSLIFSLGVPAFAADTNTHELIYKNDAAYEIQIPTTSNIDITTGKGEIDVAVTNAKLEDWTVVAITASSSNYADGTWNLVNAKNSKDKIAYTIGTTEGANDIASGDRIVTASDVTDATLYVTVSDTSKVGTFTDMITFTSEITVDLIEFQVREEYSETTSLYAANGMTWEDWVDSEYNTIGISIRNGNVKYPGGYELLTDDSTEYASSTTVIQNGKFYSFGATADRT